MREATLVGKRIPDVPVSDKPILMTEALLVTLPVAPLVPLPVMENLFRGDVGLATVTVAVDISKNQPM